MQNATLIQSITDQAQAEYGSIFSALGHETTIIFVIVGVTLLIATIFVLAQVVLALSRAKTEKANAERHAAELRNANIKFKEQLMLSQLNAKQAAIVEADSKDLDKEIPSALKLDWRSLVFEARLGSGAFGDCYKGR